MARDPDRLKWYEVEFRAELAKGLRKNLRDAGKKLHDQVKADISVKGRTVQVTTSKSGKTRKKYGKKGSFPSQPGEPPHVQTGTLRRRMFFRLVEKGTGVRVGTKAPHSHLLEYGTKRMQARPFLRPALARMKDQLAAIIGKPIQTRSSK